MKLLYLMVYLVYFEWEIFFCELILNVLDVCDKLCYVVFINFELVGLDVLFWIVICINKEVFVLEIVDNGIGMDWVELIENLGIIVWLGIS